MRAPWVHKLPPAGAGRAGLPSPQPHVREHADGDDGHRVAHSTVSQSAGLSARSRHAKLGHERRVDFAHHVRRQQAAHEGRRPKVFAKIELG